MCTHALVLLLFFASCIFHLVLSCLVCIRAICPWIDDRVTRTRTFWCASENKHLVLPPPSLASPHSPHSLLLSLTLAHNSIISWGLARHIDNSSSSSILHLHLLLLLVISSAPSSVSPPPPPPPLLLHRYPPPYPSTQSAQNILNPRLLAVDTRIASAGDRRIHFIPSPPPSFVLAPSLSTSPVTSPHCPLSPPPPLSTPLQRLPLPTPSPPLG